jgi:hypothetical protein
MLPAVMACCCALALLLRITAASSSSAIDDSLGYVCCRAPALRQYLQGAPSTSILKVPSSIQGGALLAAHQCTQRTTMNRLPLRWVLRLVAITTERRAMNQLRVSSCISQPTVLLVLAFTAT